VDDGDCVPATGDADGCPQQQAAPRPERATATAPVMAAPAPELRFGGGTSAGGRGCGKARKTQRLIGQVESAYNSGVNNYAADGWRPREPTSIWHGHDVDQRMDLKTDPQLSDEFEHLLNSINSLEMAALKAGIGILRAIEARRSMRPMR